MPRRLFLLASPHRLVTGGVLLLLLALGPVPTAVGQQALPGAGTSFSEAFKLYADALYEQAAQAFAAFRRENPDHPNTPEALYYEAEATLALGREAQAVHLLSRFQNQYPNHPLAAQARLALGKYFFEAGQYGRALEELSRVVDEGPGDELAAKALYWMGESALNMGRTDEAVGHYRRISETYRATTTAPTALYAIAVAEIKRERYDEAARALELLAARHPESTYTRDLGLALAEVYYQLEDYPRVIDEVQRRLPGLQGEAGDRALLMLAEAFNQERDSENAIVYYRRITEGAPGSPYHRRALYGLAWNYYFEGAHQWAADYFARARRGGDDDLAARATYYEAVNHKLDQQPELALPLFREYVDRWPEGALIDRALMELGVTYYEQRMWDEAREAFARLLRRSPDDALAGEAQHLLGNTLIALGNFDGALRAFDAAVALNAAPAGLKQEVLFQKAWLLYRNERYRESAPAFFALFESDPRGAKGDDALFWAAESHFQLGQLDRAGQLFRQYMRDYSGGEQIEAAYYALGWVYFKQARYAEAAQQFERFLDRYRADNEFVPYRTDATLRLADSYYALKRYPEAIRAYRRVAATGEDYALYQIGQAFYNAGDPNEAVSLFRRLLAEYPDSEWREEARYTLGYLYFLNQDYDRAITEYRTLIEQHSRDPLAAKAQYGIGDALYNAGRLDQAVDAYRRVLDRYPGSPFVSDAAAGIQYALVALEDPSRAEAIVDSFAVRNPGSDVAEELRFRRAEVAYQSGRTNEALSAFGQFTASSQNTRLLSEAYFYMGSIYADQGKTAEAETNFRRLLENYPNSPRRPEAARRLGDLYLAQKDFERALTTFRTLESMRPDDRRLVAQARYGQGMALLNLGRAGEAERLLREAADAAPDAPESAPALLGLARLQERAGRTREARQLLRQVVDRSRDDTGAEALFHLGALLLREGEAAAAVEELSRMPVLFAGYPDWIARGYLTQAQAFKQLGQTGEATRLYDLVMTEFKGTPHAQTASREKAAL